MVFKLLIVAATVVPIAGISTAIFVAINAAIQFLVRVLNHSLY